MKGRQIRPRLLVLGVVAAGLALVSAAGVAAASTATAGSPGQAGGIDLGSWSGETAAVAATGGRSYPLSFTLAVEKSSTGYAQLMVFHLSGASCTFAPIAGMATPTTRMVTWTFRATPIWTEYHGAVAFALRGSGSSVSGADLDQADPGPLSLSLTFTSASSAKGSVAASDDVTTGGHFIGTCFFPPDNPPVLRVNFTAHHA